jgi:hypothetical protein
MKIYEKQPRKQNMGISKDTESTQICLLDDWTSPLDNWTTKFVYWTTGQVHWTTGQLDNFKETLQLIKA